jgi:hypothetical protein
MASFTRRRILAGTASLAAAASLGFGALAPASALPDGIAKTRASLRPVPDVRARPTVTDAHVADAITDLESTIERAETTWNEVEDPESTTDDLPGLADPNRSLESARDYLENARDHSDAEALFDVRAGAKYAGEALGGARLALGRADGENLAANARAIIDDVETARDRVTYAVANPSVGFAQLYFVEKKLVSTRLNAYKSGVYTGQRGPTTTYSDHEVVRTWGSHMEARRTLADATRLYDDHRERTAGDRVDHTDHVRTAEARLREAASEQAVSYDAFEDALAAIEALPEGPYRTFRSEVAYPARSNDLQRPDGLRDGLLLYRAVRNARLLLTARAAATLREDAPISPDTDRVPGSLLDRTKATALGHLDDHRSETDDRPLLELVLEEGRRLVWAGDQDLEDGGGVNHPRARALADYALGREYLRELPDVLATLEEPGG